MNYISMIFQNINNFASGDRRYHMMTLLILFFVMLFPVTVNGTDPGKRQIRNELYSITLPSNWKPIQEMKGDGTVPLERDGGPFHLYYFSWMGEYEEKLESTMGVFIQSSRKLDGSSLSIEEVEEFDKVCHQPPMAKSSQKTVLNSKAGQRRYMIVEDGLILHGNYHKSRRFYIIQKSRGIVHFLNLSMGEDVYQKPGIPKLVQEILDSFIVK